MTVFVSGATGYIGSRLVPALLEAGHEVVAGIRDPQRGRGLPWWDLVDTRRCDIDDPKAVSAALRGCDRAIYLVHSLSDDRFRERDAAGARAFAAACAQQRLAQVVFLSGLIPNGALSPHLASRLEVERILSAGPVPAITLRAAVIVGAGSTSFELARRLVERSPVLPIPPWMRRRVQPVAVGDVLAEIVTAVASEPWSGRRDVGGPDRLSYSDLLALIADELGLRRPRIPTLVLPRSLAGPLAAVVTGMPSHTVSELVKSLQYDMLCNDPGPVSGRLGVREAIRRSLTNERTAAEIGGDRQAFAPSDPDWTGSGGRRR